MVLLRMSISGAKSGSIFLDHCRGERKMSRSNSKRFGFCLKQLTSMRLLLRGSIPAVMLALIAIWAMPRVASADGFEVNRTYDLKDAKAGDGKCETAIGNGTCTLRAAIEESN